jgi:hypothetical protein
MRKSYLNGVWLLFVLAGMAHGQDEVLKTPAVLAQIKEIHTCCTFGPSKTETSFRVTADGTPSNPASSNDYLKNTMRVYSTDLAIVHSHPMAGDPRPSPGDIATARSIGKPNYEVSLYAIWVTEGDGTVRKVATLKSGKHGVLIVTFLDGTVLTAVDARWYGPLKGYFNVKEVRA